jgi:hypothetical protein
MPETAPGACRAAGLFLALGGIALSRHRYRREARAVNSLRGREVARNAVTHALVDTVSVTCKLLG